MQCPLSCFYQFLIRSCAFASFLAITSSALADEVCFSLLLTGKSFIVDGEILKLKYPESVLAKLISESWSPGAKKLIKNQGGEHRTCYVISHPISNRIFEKIFVWTTMEPGTLPKYLADNREEALAAVTFLQLNELVKLLDSPNKKVIVPVFSHVDSFQPIREQKTLIPGSQ
jgi:hypothetical protein